MSLDQWARTIRCLRCRCVTTSVPRGRIFSGCPRCGHPYAEYLYPPEDRP